jgi:hypothetical protein
MAQTLHEAHAKGPGWEGLTQRNAVRALQGGCGGELPNDTPGRLG